MAVFVAYIRALGASVGAGQCFLGPQAKPHRMALMTASCLVSAAIPIFSGPSWPLVAAALWVVIGGGAITAWRRLAFVAHHLRQSKS
jgi:hypothetical protein